MIYTYISCNTGPCVVVVWKIVGHMCNIQGDSGGICNTLGNDSMCDSSKKVHMNMGPILDGYRVTGIY